MSETVNQNTEQGTETENKNNNTENKQNFNKTPMNNTAMISKMAKKQIYDWIITDPYREMLSYVQSRVMGQEDIVSVVTNIYTHLRRMIDQTPNMRIQTRSSSNNMLLCAPSGCGKTETYRAIKDYFADRIPLLAVHIVDVSSLTPAGFRGSEPSSVVAPLVGYGSEPIAIVFMDEFDKKLIPSFAEGANTSAAVQNQLLTIIEGREVPFILNGQPTGYYIDTSNTMFIGLGSFNESREQKKNAAKNNLGFGARTQDNDMFDEITREDMIKMGASYEMIGRFPLIVNYHKLSEEAVDKIIDKTLETLRLAYQLPIELDADMRTQLHEFANGVYGCRMLDSSIRDQVIKQYTAWLIGGCKKKKIVIHSVTESELV